MKTFSQYLKEHEILLAEMARVGDLTNKLEVYVRSHEGGNKPHFHIWDKATQGDDFHTCIEILHPKYFHHTGKEDTLNSQMKKELLKFLNAKPKKLRRYDTNWEVLIDMWNNGDSNMEVPEDTSIPDYMEL